MPEIVKKLSGPGIAGTEDFPPMAYVKFTEEEFAAFLADPPASMKKLGFDVDRLTVSVGNSAWVAAQRKWIKPDQAPAETRDLPQVKNWVWWCGYSDEMCVCYRVLGG